jgi:uncharacterized RDD family membrane protein YckC
MTTVTPATMGRRVAAGLLDSLLLGVVFVALAATIGETSSGDGQYSVRLDGLPALLFLAIVLGYYGLLEGTIGTSLGKLALGLRVVGDDGRRAGGRAVAIRTLLRIVDALPFLYLVGFVCALSTGRDRRARIGDLAGKTVVVPRA